MSYATRVYRQRNAHTHEDTTEQSSFFGKPKEQSFSQGGKSPFFQAKLSVGQPNDKYEKEADAVADRVVSQQSANTNAIQQKSISSIQRLSTSNEEEKLGTNDARIRRDKDIQQKPEVQMKCASCEEEEKASGAVQAKSEGGATASPQLSSKIESAAGKGSALPAKTLSEMNNTFGVDFGNVNIHTNTEAIQMNKELGAQAFTHGSDIYFNSGNFNTETHKGKQLLAHELTHVVQQRNELRQKPIQLNAEEVRLRCVQLGCSLHTVVGGEVMALTDCGRGACPTCPPGFGNLIVRAWCVYTGVSSGRQAIIIHLAFGGQVGPFEV